MDSKTWLEEGLKKTEKFKRFRGGKSYNNPQGDLYLPEFEDVVVSETIKIPVRHSIIGSHHTVCNSMPGFLAAPELGEDNWLVFQQKGHKNKIFNHPSGASFKNFVFRARNSKGLYLGGAQQTVVENVTGYDFGEYGIAVGPGSHTFAMRDIYLAGSSWPSGIEREYFGTCLYLDRVNGSFPCHSIKLHRANRGLHLRGAHEVNFDGDIEHTNVPIKIEYGSSNCEIKGRLHFFGNYPIDLHQAREVYIKVKMNSPRFPGQQWIRNPRGKWEKLLQLDEKGKYIVEIWTYRDMFHRWQLKKQVRKV